MAKAHASKGYLERTVAGTLTFNPTIHYSPLPTYNQSLINWYFIRCPLPTFSHFPTHYTWPHSLSPSKKLALFPTARLLNVSNLIPLSPAMAFGFTSHPIAELMTLHSSLCYPWGQASSTRSTSHTYL